MSANTLTGIFAPGSPALLETLRTLAVTPAGTTEPGALIRVEFTFLNVGGAAATGVRARFALPGGVEPVAGSDTIDDAPLRSGESFVAVSGASVGELESNVSRRISMTYKVHDVIEDGTELAFQAAVVSDQLSIAGSNVERVTVRSKPALQNPSTLVTIVAPDEPKPGDQFTVRATIVNTGRSSAHDVIAVLPVPENATYIARTARLAGRPVPDGDGEPFDYDSGTVVARRLAPSQTVVAEYQAAIVSPIDDGTRIKVTGAIASRELAEFALCSSEIVVHSPVDFSDDETGLTVFSDDAVTPGTRIALSMRAANHGTGHAHDVHAAFDLPTGLIYTPGSLMIDGQPVGDESFRDGTVALGTIPPGRDVEAGLSAMVGVPPEGDFALPIAARLRWKGGERRFARRLTVRATPRFARARNYIEVDRRVAQAEEDVDFRIHLLNDGTAPDRLSELRIMPGAFVGQVRILDEVGAEVPYDSPIPLGVMEPHVERTITVRAKIVPPVPDRATVTVGAVLEQRERVIDLGVGSLVVRSRPHVSVQNTGWELQRNEPLRPNETADVVIRFTNDGSDTLRDARALLDVPADFTIERAYDARREHTTLYFGDIPAKKTHEARFTLRLLRAGSGRSSKTIAGALQGRGISALPFVPLEVATFSQPEFEAAAQLRTSPHDYVNAGERIMYDLVLRNTGDGPANVLNVRAVPSNLAVYVPATTTVNGVAVPDDVGTSALWSQRGMMLTEIDPGVDVRVHWEMLAVTPLAAGTALDARVMLSWDGDRSHAIVGPTLHIQAAPNLAGDLAVGSISIAQTLAKGHSQAPESWQEAPEISPAVVEPAPQPVSVEQTAEPAAHSPTAAPEPLVETQPAQAHAAPMPEAIAEIVERSHVAPDAQAVAPSLPTVYVDFGPEKLSRSLRMLEKSDFDGMLPHLFAIRLFFPESIINAAADVEKSFRIANRAMQNALDRLFVRLRIPRYAITSKDLEDRDSRFALRQLVSTVIATDAREGGDGRAAGVVRISGPVDTHDLRALQPELESAPLGSAVPWQVAAAMLGSTIHRDGDTSTAMHAYRTQLISVLGTLHALPLEEFHRVLRDRPNRAVDDALQAVLENLRSAAHIAAE